MVTPACMLGTLCLLSALLGPPSTDRQGHVSCVGCHKHRAVSLTVQREDSKGSTQLQACNGCHRREDGARLCDSCEARVDRCWRGASGA